MPPSASDSGIISGINVTPLVDITLVLIIIFANIPDVGHGGLWGHTTPAVELKSGPGGH